MIIVLLFECYNKPMCSLASNKNVILKLVYIYLIAINKYYFFVAYCILCMIASKGVQAQDALQSFRKNIYAITDTITLDTLSIVPQSVQVYNSTETPFILLAAEAKLIFKQKPNTDSVLISYRTFSNNFAKAFQNKSTELISAQMGGYNPYSATEANATYNNSFVEQGNMDYSGSLSRAITFGNSQDLSLNSQFNLQLNGMLADSIQLQASLTDNTIPFQPDGTTQNLQEFDRIAIEFKKRNASLMLGDYDMLRPASHFMNYYKRVQGARFSNAIQLSKNINYNYTAGASLAKGKYVRAALPVVEGNQGPYKIQGPNGELYFTILANTEKITIDGIQLVRGEDRDYIVDYNVGEITFMPNKMITKDSRVIVEYEFNDRNYINSLLYSNNEWRTKNQSRFYVNIYTNQDAKNQSLIQTLSPANKQFLSTIGDNIQQAFYPNVRTDTFNTDRIMYKLIDSTVGGVNYDSIYVYSTSADSAKYLVGFTFVGQGNGSYEQSINIANGRVYQWIAPQNGVMQGSFAPYILLITPKRQQMISAGVQLPLGKNKSLNYEAALSNNDPNLFSSLGENHIGVAHKLGYNHKIPFGKNKNQTFTANAQMEFVPSRFRALENYRNQEFSRDWNVAFATKPANEYIASAEMRIAQVNTYDVYYGLSNYNRSKIYNGLRHNVGANATWKQWHLRTNNSLTTTQDTSVKAQYFRPDVEVFRSFKKIGGATFGAKYLGENNDQKYISTDSVAKQSFAFDVKTIYLNNGNTADNKYAITYFTRQDKLPIRNELAYANRSHNIALSTDITTLKHHAISVNATYRRLNILDTTLSKIPSEDNLLGRVGYTGRFFKNAISYDALYEFGSGQELKREFAYIQVATGQGLYTWRDYNNDKIKQLNEFEIAVFQNEKDYVRVFTPGNTYLKAKYNIFNQSLSISPAMFFAKESKSKIKSFMARWFLQSQVQTNAKYIDVQGLGAYIPFNRVGTDTSVLSRTQSITNSVFFNRQSGIWNMSYQQINNATTVLLTYGVDARVNKEHYLQGRYNINKKFMLQAGARKGSRTFTSPFLSTRNYAIDYVLAEPNITYLSRNSNFSTALGAQWSKKQNAKNLGGEMANIKTYYTEAKYVVSGASNIKSRFTYSGIAYNGVANATLSYIILDGLSNGNNFIFTAGIDKKVSKGLELNISYEGRKPQGISLINTGNISARALF